MDHYRTTTRGYSHYSYGPLQRTATMDHYHGPLLQTTARDSLLRQRRRLRLLITNYRPLTTDYWLLTTDYWTLTTDYGLLLLSTATDIYWLPTSNNCLLLTSGYPLLTTDYCTAYWGWLLTTDYCLPTTHTWPLWLLTTDCWPLTAHFAMFRNSHNLCSNLNPIANSSKNYPFRPLFDPNRKFLEKMSSSAPFVGGTTAGPEKWKITIKKQQETITKNPGTIFEVQVPEIVGKSSISLFFQSKSSKKWGYARIRLEKNSGTQDLARQK